MSCAPESDIPRCEGPASLSQGLRTGLRHVAISRTHSGDRRGRHSRSPTLESLLFLVMVIVGFGDLPGKASLGPISLGGMLTILIVLALCGGLLLCRSFPKLLLLRLSPNFAFLAWLGFRSIWAPPDFYGVQQILVQLVFSLCLVLGGLVAARNPSGAVHLINSAVRWTARPALGLVGISLITNGVEGPWYIGPRIIALLGIVLISWYFTRLYRGMPHSWVPISVWLGVIILSDSRTASAVAVFLLLLVTLLKAWHRRSGILPAVGLVFFVAAGTAVAFSRIPQFREHMLSGDTGHVGINVNGRVEAWQMVVASARESPIVGKGVGSSGALLASLLAGFDHPHNDYLRIWHDLGLIGLGLFVLTLVSWASILARAWYRAEKQGVPVDYMELAGLLALLSMMLAMVTDNPVVYTTVMAPMGILVGGGLGTAAHTRVRRLSIPHTKTWPSSRHHQVS